MANFRRLLIQAAFQHSYNEEFERLLKFNHSEIMQYCNLTHLPVGEVLYKTGDFSENVFLLTHGRVSYYLEVWEKRRAPASAKEVVVDLHMKRVRLAVVFQGPIGGFSELPNGECAVIEQPSTVLVVSKAEFERMQKQSPDLFVQLYRCMLGDQIRFKNRASRFTESVPFNSDPYFISMKHRMMTKIKWTMAFSTLTSSIMDFVTSRHAKELEATVTGDSVRYSWSYTQKNMFVMFFANHQSDESGGEDMIPVSQLRAAAVELGFYHTQAEVNEILDGLNISQAVNLNEFLKFMKRISMTPFSEREHQILKCGFDIFDVAQSGFLTQNELMIMFENLSVRADPETVKEMVSEWGQKTNGQSIDFGEFLGLLAFCSKRARHHQGLREDFDKIARNGKNIAREDLQKFFYENYRIVVSSDDADEMLWNADLDCDGSVKMDDFLQLATTVYEPGWFTIWNWKKGNAIKRLSVDAVVAANFKDVDESVKMSSNHKPEEAGDIL